MTGGPHLIYFADPMCSWCWGFSPVIAAIGNRFGSALPIRLIMGGLRPGTKEPMTEAAKAAVREHWVHVQEASGQPFDFAFFERESFIYDTEPASRAVVVARRRSMADGLAMLRSLQEAFYAGNRDVTALEELASIATALGFEPLSFCESFASQEVKDETSSDYAISQGAGIKGFPALVVGRGGNPYTLVTQGFQPADSIVPVIERWLDRD